MNRSNRKWGILKVPFFALFLEVIVFFVPLFSIKENRISDGASYSLFPMTHWSSLLFPAIVLLTLCVVLFAWNRRRHLEATAGFLLFLFPWVHLSFTSGFLMKDLTEAARISPQTGTWICVAAAYVLFADATKFIKSKGFVWVVLVLPFVIIAGLVLGENLAALSILREYNNKSGRFLLEFTTHIYLSGTSVLIACIVGIPLGLLAYKKKIFTNGIFLFANTVQTIPSLALFGLLIAPLSYISHQYPVLREIGIKGIGAAPALIALSLYALLPVTLNTFTSLRQIDNSVKEAGRGMGMGVFQLFFMVEFPLSLPVLLNGIRVAAVLTIGNTAVAALIRAGGLGSFIFQGLGQSAPDLILLGVIPIIALAIFTDRLFALLIYIVGPVSMRTQFST